MTVKSYQNRIAGTTGYRFYVYGNSAKEWNLTANVIQLSTAGCDVPHHLRYWNDPKSWKVMNSSGTHIVPGPNDNVFISPNAGVVQLQSDVTVNQLNMQGGQILGYEKAITQGTTNINNPKPSTGCPPGWSFSPFGKYA